MPPQHNRPKQTRASRLPRRYVSIIMKQVKHPRCPTAFSPLCLIQATRRSFTATAVVPKRVTARRQVQRVFVCAPRDRVRCARLWMASSCEMLLTEILSLPLQSRQQGLRTPKVFFIPESKPRGDFHQLDARLRLSGYYVSRLMDRGFIMVTRWPRRGCVIFLLLFKIRRALFYAKSET